MRVIRQLFWLITVLISFSVLGEGQLKIPDLRTLAGDGVVEEYFYKTLESKKMGRIEFIEDYPVMGKKSCQGIQLWIEAEFEEAIVLCGSEEFFFCGHVDKCDPSNSDKVKVAGNKLEQRYELSFSDERNRLIEMYEDALIIHYQIRNCLVEGPHAMCFFEGFSWKDFYTTRFKRTSHSND